jgi:hypothetical protein
MLGWKYLMMPDWSAGAMYVLRARIGYHAPGARRTVSKLNVNTFQAVNYPLVELVRAL